MFFGVDDEKTVWYFEMSSFDNNIENVHALLKNSDECHDDLMEMAHSFINNDWIELV